VIRRSHLWENAQALSCEKHMEEEIDIQLIAKSIPCIYVNLSKIISIMVCMHSFHTTYQNQLETFLQVSTKKFSQKATVSSSNPRKRTKATKNSGRVDVAETGHLETWFPGDRDHIKIYLLEYNKIIINSPKNLKLSWLKDEKLHDVRKMLKHPKLAKFLNLTRNFFTNLSIGREKMISHVKGLYMEITPAVRKVVVGLNFIGVKAGKGNVVALEDFNKIQFFKSCLRNPHVAMRGFNVRGLAMNPRITAFVIVLLLTPRGH